VLLRRRERVADVCSSSSAQSSHIQVGTTHLYVLKARRLLWCPVYKAASTSWMTNLLTLANRSAEDLRRLRETYPSQPNMQARAVAPMLTSSRLAPLLKMHRFTKLLIVRHPFGRLVSAFRDKLERYNNYYYTNYGRKIVARFRKRAQAKFGSDFFSEKNNFGALVASPGRNSSSLPTWWEFVQYVLATAPRRMSIGDLCLSIALLAQLVTMSFSTLKS